MVDYKTCLHSFVPMMKNLTILILLLLTQTIVFGQSNNATLKGVINDQKGVPIDMVNVVLKEYIESLKKNKNPFFKNLTNLKITYEDGTIFNPNNTTKKIVKDLNLRNIIN